MDEEIEIINTGETVLQDKENSVIEDEIDIIEIISNSSPNLSHLPFLTTIGDPDKILNVVDLLKETRKDISGKTVPIFSFGPWPKIKRFENQLRPINCHICRYTTIKREEMKNHISRQRHIRRLNIEFDEKYFKPMKNFYDWNANKAVILFLINAGDNIEKVTKTDEDRLIEYKKEALIENSKISLEPANNDKLYDLNEVNPILGLEYCIKLTNSSKSDEYYCVLCEEFVQSNNVNHFLDCSHQDEYIEKHFAELSEYCLNILQDNINNKMFCEKKKREILVEFYRKIEIQNGLRHIYRVEQNLFTYFREEYIEKINKLSHYSASPNELSTNNVINNIVNNYIKRSLYMKQQWQRKQNENKIKNSTEHKESQIYQKINNKVTNQLDSSSRAKPNQPEEINSAEFEEQLTKVQNNIKTKSEDRKDNMSAETEIITDPSNENQNVLEKNIEYTQPQTEIIRKVNEKELKDFSADNEFKITKNIIQSGSENNIETICNESKQLESKKFEHNVKCNSTNINKSSETILENNIETDCEQLESDILENKDKAKSTKKKITENAKSTETENNPAKADMIKNINKTELKDITPFNKTNIIKNSRESVFKNHIKTNCIEVEQLESKKPETNENLKSAQNKINITEKEVTGKINKKELNDISSYNETNIIKNCTKKVLENNIETNSIVSEKSEKLEKKDIANSTKYEINPPKAEIIAKINKTELKDISSCNETNITKNSTIRVLENNCIEGEELKCGNSENNDKSKSTEYEINPPKAEIIVKINKTELKDISSCNETNIDTNSTIRVLEKNCIEGEQLKCEDSENNDNTKSTQNKVNIENVIILKTANVGKLTDEKNITEINHISSGTFLPETNKIVSEENLPAAENIDIYENVHISMNSMEIDNLNINNIENITENNICKLNSVKLEGSIDISINSMEVDNLNIIDSIENITDNSMCKVNFVSSENSNFSEFDTNIIKGTDESINNSTDKSIFCNSNTTCSQILLKEENDNKNTTCDTKNVSFKERLFEIYDKCTQIHDNNKKPILSYGPPNTHLNTRCHVCDVKMNPNILQINEHINGQKHKNKLRQGRFKNPIRCFYKTNEKNSKVFIDVYAGEYIDDETTISEKQFHYMPEPAKKLVINKSFIAKQDVGNKLIFKNKSEKMIDFERKNEPPNQNSEYKIFLKEFPPKVIEKLISLKILFKNNHLVSMFSFGPRLIKNSSRTINCHLCKQTLNKLADLTHHIKTNYHQQKKHTIKWIDLKKPMHLFYKNEKNNTEYFEIWPGENIFKVNSKKHENRIINANQIASEDSDDDEKIYENKANVSIMGLEYGIKLKKNEEIYYCFCLLCSEKLSFENSQYFKHFNSETHKHNYINKHFPRYKQQIYNKIPTDIIDSNIRNAIFLKINLNIYKKMEQNFGYRKMYTTSEDYFTNSYIFFTTDFNEKNIHYNDELNLLLENDISEIIENIIKSFSIAEFTLKRRRNDLLQETAPEAQEINLLQESLPKRMKFDSTSSNQLTNENVQSSSINFISVLRLLSVVEDILGPRLGGLVLELLGKAAFCEKNEGNFLKLTTNNNVYMFVLTINEKLKGLLQSQLIESQKLPLVERLLNELPILINIMEQDKRNLNQETVSRNDNNLNFGDNWFNNVRNNNYLCSGFNTIESNSSIQRNEC